MALYILEDKNLHPFLSKRTAQEITAVKALNQKKNPHQKYKRYIRSVCSD